MTIQDRAHDIRARLTADMSKTATSCYSADSAVLPMVEDAMHQVELLLVEIQGHEERAATTTALPPTSTV